MAPGLGPRHPEALARVLTAFKPDVVVLNMGLHYPGPHRMMQTRRAYEPRLRLLEGGSASTGHVSAGNVSAGNASAGNASAGHASAGHASATPRAEEYHAHLLYVLRVLARYHASYRRQARAHSASAVDFGNGTRTRNGTSDGTHGPPRRSPLLLLRETTPQHFPTPRGDGSWDAAGDQVKLAEEAPDPEYDGRCASRSIWREDELADVDVGAVALNRVLWAAARAFYPAVGVLPAFRSLAQRHEAHLERAEKPTDDCTHFCYAPLLWDATLAPFYERVLAWAQGQGGAVAS